MDSNSAGELGDLQKKLHSLYKKSQKHRPGGKSKHTFCTRKQKATYVSIQDEKGNGGPSKDNKSVGRILEGTEVAVSIKIGKSESMDKQSHHLNFGLQKYCKHKGQTRHLLNDREIDWHEEEMVLKQVDKSKLEVPETSSETEELLMCLSDKVDQLYSETEGVKVALNLSSETTHSSSLVEFTQELANCEKIRISHRKNMLLPCDSKLAVVSTEDNDFCDEAYSMKMCLSLNREAFYAKVNVLDLQKGSVGIGKLNLCDLALISHSGTVSEVNNLSKGGKRLKMWDYEAENSCGPPVKRICLADISVSASTHSYLSHKMGFRCVDDQFPVNSHLSALSLFNELAKLSPVFKQNKLQEFVRLFCSMSRVCLPFSLLDKPTSVFDVSTDHKICTWSGNCAAAVGVNVAKCVLPGPLETGQKINAVHFTLCACFKKSILPERKEQNNSTSSQTRANTINSVKKNSMTEVQTVHKETTTVDCSFLGSLPNWSTVSDVQSETAEAQDQNRDNGITRSKLHNKELVTGDSLILPSSRAVVSELQLLSDRSSLMPTEDNEEFGVSTTDERWTFEDIFASGEGFLPLHRPVVQKTTVSDKSQGSGDKNLLKLNNMCNSNGVLSPDYGFWEGDDTVGLLGQTTSLNDKFCNVLSEHCDTLVNAHFPKPAEGNHESSENIFQKGAEYKEKQVIERLCELLDVHIFDSNRKDTDNCSDTTTSVVTKLPNITKGDQAINKCVKHKNTEQKQEGKVIIHTDSQFQQISPEHVLLDDMKCLRNGPQRGDETKEKEILDCPLSITDSKLSPNSGGGGGIKEEEKEEEEEEENDDDDSSSESSSSVATVVLNPSWVPQNPHRCSEGNQCQQTYRRDNGLKDGSVSQQNDHTYAIVECEQPVKAISCVARINGPMTDSERNCDNERTETVYHTLDSDQSYSGPQLDGESAEGNEPPMHYFDDQTSTTVPSTEVGNSVSLLINPPGTYSDLDQKLVKDSDTLLVETDSHRNTTVQTDPHRSGAVQLGCKYSLNSEQQTPSSRITKEVGNNLSLTNLTAVPRSEIQVCHHKTNTVADKILCRANKKLLDIHRTSVGETLLPVKQPEKLSRSSLAEKGSLQSNPVAHTSDMEQAEHYTSKRKRKRVSESVEMWLENNIKSFPGTDNKQVFEEISKDVAYNLATETRNASRVGPVSISLRKPSSIDCRSDEKTGFDTVQTESLARLYKRCRGGEGLVTVKTHLTGECSVKKTSKEVTGVKLSCQYCGKIFYRPSKLKDHIGTHTLPYHCLQCGRRFAKESQLVTHKKLLSCSPHETCRYKCEGCDQKFLQRVCLLNHVEKHLKQDKEEGVEKSRCKFCGRVFDQAKLLLLHEEVHVTKKRLHTCGVCGKVFERQAALVRHRRLHLECSYCGEYFKGKDPLRTHIRQHLKDEKEKALNERRKMQRDEDVLRDELSETYPTVQREFSALVCPECGKIFRWKTSLQRHLAEHRREDRRKAAARFLCDNCDATFTSKASLRNHSRQHIRAKADSASVKVRWPRQPPKCDSNEDASSPPASVVLQFSCEKCHTDFPQLSELQYHSCGLGDRRQYMCYICDKAFLSQSHLSHHIRFHFPAYKCRYCGDTFARRYEWRYHEWSHEN